MLSPETVLQARYRIIRQLGQGGMGAVYEAVDTRLDTTVALKETLFADEKLRKQFEREARLLARLHHPALPRVSDHFNEGDGQFLVMQYVAGEDLAAMQAHRTGPFPQEEVLRWGDQLCDALDYLHTQDPQIIHRDIKPQNLKLTERGQIVLLDFGLAKGSAGQMSVVTTSASIFGYTPNYAPLEQVQGLGTDARSDIYSLGATLYHLMTNVKPPDALSRAGALINGQPDPLLPANRVETKVSGAVASALAVAMSQRRDDRYLSAPVMREAFRAARDGAFDETLLSSGATAFGAASTVASEEKTRLAGDRTTPIGGEAQTLLAANRTNARTQAGETTVVRSASGAKKSRAWLAVPLALVLIAGGAFGIYAYRARQRQAQQSAAPAPQSSTQTVQPNPTPAASIEKSTESAAEKVTDAKKLQDAAGTASQRASKQKHSEAAKSAQPTPADRNAAAQEMDRNQDRGHDPNNVPPPRGAPPLDPLQNQRGRQPGRQFGMGQMPDVRTFPNGMRVVTQPDGTRIVTMPNGTTRIIPPGVKPNRKRP